MKFTVKVYEETQAFQSIGAKLAQKQLPGCDHLPPRSDAYYECFIRHLTMTIYHPCCTARFVSLIGTINKIQVEQLVGVMWTLFLFLLRVTKGILWPYWIQNYGESEFIDHYKVGSN